MQNVTEGAFNLHVTAGSQFRTGLRPTGSGKFAHQSSSCFMRPTACAGASRGGASGFAS
jgi:hypothetical protein